MCAIKIKIVTSFVFVKLCLNSSDTLKMSLIYKMQRFFWGLTGHRGSRLQERSHCLELNSSHLCPLHTDAFHTLLEWWPHDKQKAIPLCCMHCFSGNHYQQVIFVPWTGNDETRQEISSSKIRQNFCNNSKCMQNASRTFVNGNFSSSRVQLPCRYQDVSFFFCVWNC